MKHAKPDLFGKALRAGAALHKGESAAAAVLAGARESRLPVQEIDGRYNDATRALDPAHVVDLAESISALGLIEPLALDQERRLLAGGHRFFALRLLALSLEERANLARMILGPMPAALLERLEALPVLVDPVPVHLLPLDSKKDPATALAVEIAENEKRRNYTRLEVEGLAESMRRVGFRDAGGRPKKGERALVPALAVVLGKSEKTVRRMLAGEDGETWTNVQVSGDKLAAAEDRRLLAALERWKERRGLYGASTPCRQAFSDAVNLSKSLEALTNA